MLGRGAHTVVQKMMPRNYWTRHEAYVHPKYAIENDNVTIQGMTPTHAFFCVSDKDRDVYNTDVRTCL